MHASRGKNELNGTWSGYLGDIQNGRLQVSMPSMLSFDRLEIMDFLSPLNGDR